MKELLLEKIQGTMLPSFIKYVEFIDDRATKNGGHGNSWIFWIDTSGFLHVKLKNPNVDRMPEVGEVMTFSFEIVFGKFSIINFRNHQL